LELNKKYIEQLKSLPVVPVAVDVWKLEVYFLEFLLMNEGVPLGHVPQHVSVGSERVQ